MRNPFKFGMVVEDPFFTDRREEAEQIKRTLNSSNHLILISPRRYGKTSLIKKVLKNTETNSIYINVQQFVSIDQLSSKLLQAFLKLHPLEKIRHLIAGLRILPQISINPISGSIDVSFKTGSSSADVLSDVIQLIEKVTGEERLIIVLDEFQNILSLETDIDHKLRAIFQEQEKVNYIFLGSQESMMSRIFDHVQSPFYHFGTIMHLGRIPRADFAEFISNALAPLYGIGLDDLVNGILDFTHCHPYYTQQLCATVWTLAYYDKVEKDKVLDESINQLILSQDLNYERLWINFTKTERTLLLLLAEGKRVVDCETVKQTTLYSAEAKLAQNGYVIKDRKSELEDPFFARWILKQDQEDVIINGVI